MRIVRRVWRDVRGRRHVEAYVIAAVSLCLTVLSLIGDIVGDDVRWSVVLAALTLLVYRITVADPDHPDTVLRDRTAFDRRPFASRLGDAREVWIFGPAATNLLTEETANHLRSTVLRRKNGLVRVIVLDPSDTAAVEIASRQLDESLDYPVGSLRRALPEKVGLLELMSRWDVAGELAFRFAPYNPGFSLVAVDPSDADGTVMVEFHGFHNESTASRMHIELTPAESARWFAYWVDQFEHMWKASAAPAPPGPAPAAPTTT